MRYIYLCYLQIQNPTYLSLTSSCTIHPLFSFLLFNFHIHIHSPWYNIISLPIITIFRITHHIAFVSASRAATIPVSISSALSSGHVTETIARFVIPLGATASRYSLLLFMYYVVLYLY